MTINPDANITKMLDQWVNGNKNDTIKALADDHPGLTAFFLTVGIKRRLLSLGDVNTIVSRLMDSRVAMALDQES